MLYKLSNEVAQQKEGGSSVITMTCGTPSCRIGGSLD